MYLWLKVLHILAVVGFLGNITTGLFWHRHAARTRDPRLLAHTMDGIIRSDRVFTMPGVLTIIVTGVWSALVVGYPLLKTGWIFWALVLFSVSGLTFGLRVAPLQRELLALSAGKSGSFDYDRYHRVARRWEAWGAVALLSPVGALLLMVLKPAL